MQPTAPELDGSTEGDDGDEKVEDRGSQEKTHAEIGMTRGRTGFFDERKISRAVAKSWRLEKGRLPAQAPTRP